MIHIILNIVEYIILIAIVMYIIRYTIHIKDKGDTYE